MLRCHDGAVLRCRATAGVPDGRIITDHHQTDRYPTRYVGGIDNQKSDIYRTDIYVTRDCRRRRRRVGRLAASRTVAASAAMLPLGASRSYAPRAGWSATETSRRREAARDADARQTRGAARRRRGRGPPTPRAGAPSRASGGCSRAAGARAASCRAAEVSTCAWRAPDGRLSRRSRETPEPPARAAGGRAAWVAVRGSWWGWGGRRERRPVCAPRWRDLGGQW